MDGFCAGPVLENGAKPQQRGYSKKHNTFNSNSPPPEPANSVEWKRRLVISIEAGTLPALCNTQEVGIIYCPPLTDDRSKAQGSWAFFPNPLSWLTFGKGRLSPAMPEPVTSPLPWSTCTVSTESVLSVDRLRKSEGMFVPRGGFRQCHCACLPRSVLLLDNLPRARKVCAL